MLRNASDFPHAGCRAYLAPDGDPVRVIRHNADGTSLVALLPVAHDPRRHLDAAANRTVSRGDLFETAQMVPVPRTKRRTRRAPASSSAAIGRQDKAA